MGITHNPKHEAYRPDERAPVSALYTVVHAGHRPDHDVIMLEGDAFPCCRACGFRVQFFLSTLAPYGFHDMDFAGPRLLGSLIRHPERVNGPIPAGAKQPPKLAERERGVVLEFPPNYIQSATSKWRIVLPQWRAMKAEWLRANRRLRKSAAKTRVEMVKVELCLISEFCNWAEIAFTAGQLAEAHRTMQMARRELEDVARRIENPHHVPPHAAREMVQRITEFQMRIRRIESRFLHGDAADRPKRERRVGAA